MYKGILSDEFLRATRKVDRQKLYDFIQEILLDPYNSLRSHVLGYKWAGYRGADFDNTQRLVFRICEECVRKNQQALNPLPCCADGHTDSNAAKVINFVDFGDYHRNARKPLIPNRRYEYPGDSAPDALIDKS